MNHTVRNNHEAFTIAEIMVVVFAVVILFSLLSPVLTNTFNQQFFIQEQNEAIEQARKGIQILVQDIREAADGDNGAFPVESGDDNFFVFFSDVDVDAVTERIRYFAEGKALKRGVTEPSGFPLTYNPGNEVITIVVPYVENLSSSIPVFRYYNDDFPGDTINNPLSTPVDINELSLVEVRLLVNVDPTNAPDSIDIVSFVHIRNVKDNL